MTRSLRKLNLGVWLISALGLALACGSEEATAPTGLPMGQAAPAQEAAAKVQDGPNSPPTIELVVLRPDDPRPGERLTAVVEAFDAEGDAMRLSFKWTVDGVGLSHSGAELMLRNVSKGSLVAVEVTATDSWGDSSPFEVNVTIANRPPVIQGVVLEPLGLVSTAHDVTAVPRSYDPDGDEVSYEYVWTVNGDDGYGDGAVLYASEFKRGDEITLEVVASDGEDTSKPLQSKGIRVVNAKPKITSAPSGFGGEKFLYLVQVDDPDDDRRMRFHLIKGPDGMSIDNLSGKITWIPDFDQDGTHAVEVMVADGHGGEDTQTFNLDFGFEDEDVPASPQE